MAILPSSWMHSKTGLNVFINSISLINNDMTQLKEVQTGDINNALAYIGADPGDFHLTDAMFFRSTMNSIHGIDQRTSSTMQIMIPC